MKKNFLMLLLGGAMLMPTTVIAQPSGNNDEPKPDVRRSPAKRPHAYINYDENSGVANITFLTTIADAEIVVWQNGEQASSQSLVAAEGTQIPLYLPAYGTGEFTIQVKSGSTLIAIYYTTL